MIHTLFTDANVEFLAPTFMSNEESQLAVICVTLMDDIEREITVNLSSTEQSKIILFLFVKHCE